jgi:ATP-dependent DNA helicase PIF1
MDTVHVLQTIFRQTDDEYKKILNQIRIGKISTNTIAKLKQRVCPYDTKHTPTLLYPTRSRADTFNTMEYAKLTDPEFQYNLDVVHETDTLNAQQKKIRSGLTTAQIEYETSLLLQSLMVVPSLKLKLGTRVMCVANIDPDHFTIVNGSQGIVIGFQGEFSYPVVQFHNGIVRHMVPHIWTSETIPGLTIRQVPLIYAWAITIHKAQGLTLDAARIDAGSRIFECGQTYVALSRVRTLNSLYLCEFEPSHIRVNRKVKQFYDNLIV